MANSRKHRYYTFARFYNIASGDGEATMSERPSATEIQELANLADGIAHPVRVCILYVLRREKKIRGVELRKEISEMYVPVDARNLQFHLYKMQSAGLVRVSKEGRNDVVELECDVTLKVKK